MISAAPHTCICPTLVSLSAIVFEEPVNVRPCGYPMPPILVSLPISEGKPYPERRQPTNIEFTEHVST